MSAEGSGRSAIRPIHSRQNETRSLGQNQWRLDRIVSGCWNFVSGGPQRGFAGSGPVNGFRGPESASRSLASLESLRLCGVEGPSPEVAAQNLPLGWLLVLFPPSSSIMAKSDRALKDPVDEKQQNRQEVGGVVQDTPKREEGDDADTMETNHSRVHPVGPIRVDVAADRLGNGPELR